MIPSNFRIEILAIRALLCALGTKGLSNILWANEDLAHIHEFPKCNFGHETLFLITMKFGKAFPFHWL